jgi:hypothetical protein
MMKYYKIVISGENIFFENFDNPDPIIGFIAFRLVQAQDEELAVATAKRNILVHWNQSFNADRKLGLPTLQIEHVAPFAGWLKPKTKHDYYWFSDSETRQTQMDRFIKPPRKWFGIRWRKNH